LPVVWKLTNNPYRVKIQLGGEIVNWN